MSERVFEDTWGVILGGSSGFGLATAHALAERGMNLCLVHRDRRAALRRVEPRGGKSIKVVEGSIIQVDLT